MTEDPALAIEVIALLGDELQRVQSDIGELRLSKRSQSIALVRSDASLYALQEENMRLQQESRELARRHMEIQRQKPARKLTGMAFEDVCQRSMDVALFQSLDPTRAPTHMDYDENIGEKLQSKLSTSKEKYQQAKSRRKTLRKTIAGTEALLEEITSEQHSALERLKNAEAELRKLNPTIRVFSPKEFLRRMGAGVSSFDGTAASKAIVFQIGERLELPPDVGDLCAPGGFISKNHKEVVWADHPKTRCVTLSPTHRYHPAIDGGHGRWETLLDMRLALGEEMDMFFMNERKEWQYVGTYRCVGRAILSCHEVQKFAPTRVHSAIDRTMVRDATPAVVRTAVKQMYTMDVMKIACTGWQRVAFNEGLARILRPEGPQMTYNDHGPESALTTKRHGDDDELGGKSWKRYKRT